MVFSVYFLTVRAFHIEVVPTLDTYSSLKPVIQFLPIRGKPSTVISNNGTNYVGAVWEFSVYVAAWNDEGIEEKLIKQGIKEKFNSPAALTLKNRNGWSENARKQCRYCWGTDKSSITFIQLR